MEVFQDSLLLLFVILATGSLIGKIKIGSITVSTQGGVLFVAIVFGLSGWILSGDLGKLGFSFFIYSIGFGAGPRFFSTFKKNGIRYGLVAVFVVTCASTVALFCAKLFDLPILTLPGILAGALTSTSTLATAYETTSDPLVSIGYGITYPFGLLGFLMMIQYFPRLIRIDLKREARRMESVAAVFDEDDQASNPQQIRGYIVRNPDFINQPLKYLNLPEKKHVIILLVKRKNKIRMATADTILRKDDQVVVEGNLEDLIRLEHHIGPEVRLDEKEEKDIETARVVVNKKHALNKPLKDLNLTRSLGVLITRIQRSGVDIGIKPHSTLERQDIVTLTGPARKVRDVVNFLGREEHKIYETDIFTFCAGLLMGLLIARIRLPVIQTPLGNAAGLLMMGILMGQLRNFGPFSGRVPLAARYILQEIGMLIFIASVGTVAGKGLMEHGTGKFMEMFLTGFLITTLTLFGTLFFCRLVLKFDWNTSMGATVGGVTSTAALHLITHQADSQYAVLGYAGVYAFANILLAALGQIILLFV